MDWELASCSRHSAIATRPASGRRLIRRPLEVERDGSDLSDRAQRVEVKSSRKPQRRCGLLAILWVASARRVGIGAKRRAHMYQRRTCGGGLRFAQRHPTGCMCGTRRRRAHVHHRRACGGGLRFAQRHPTDCMCGTRRRRAHVHHRRACGGGLRFAQRHPTDCMCVTLRRRAHMHQRRACGGGFRSAQRHTAGRMRGTLRRFSEQ